MPRTNLHRSQFTFYASYYNAIEHLPKSRRYEALRAVIRYALEGELPEDLSPAAHGVFDAIRPNLEAGRTKAAARIRELKEENSVSPTGKNKKKKENEYKKENEFKKENKNETEQQGEKETSTEEKSAPGAAAREEHGAAAAAGSLSTKMRYEDDLFRLTRENPGLEQVLNQMLAHWEKSGQPLTPEERKLWAWSLAVHSPEEQVEAVLDAMAQNSRSLRFRAGTPT